MPKLNDKQIQLIKQKIPLDNGKMIVRLNVAGNKKIPINECNNNIYCINENYEILWQIKSKPTGFFHDPFISINLDNGDLKVKNFSGFKYKVNLINGEVEAIDWDK